MGGCALDFLIFLVCAGAIAAAGPKMVDTVEVVSARTGVGQVWIGSILLAGATSLPELVSAVSGAAIDEPDLAVGTLLGSNMFNMTIFGAVVLLATRSVRPDPSGAAAGLVAIVMTGAALVFLLVEAPEVGRMGAGSIVLVGIYVLASFLLFRVERRRACGGGGEAPERSAAPPASFEGVMSLRRAGGWLLATTAVVFVASIFIAGAADGIAETIGVSGGVVGVVAVAFATSLPEVVTSFAALRRGATGLLVGNVFGSNVFNMVVIFAADLSLDEGAVLQAASNDQAVTAVFGIGLMVAGLALVGWQHSRRTTRAIGALMLVGYLVGIVTVVSLGVEGG